jgi:hypothetical protein
MSIPVFDPNIDFTIVGEYFIRGFPAPEGSATEVGRGGVLTELPNPDAVDMDWGYVGTGSLNLAEAILRFAFLAMDFPLETANSRTKSLARRFLLDVVSQFPLRGWLLLGHDIESWILANA